MNIWSCQERQYGKKIHLNVWQKEYCVGEINGQEVTVLRAAFNKAPHQ